MNLSFVTPSFYPAFIYGGPTVANYALCEALAAQGVQISVITTDANGVQALSVEKNNPVVLSPGFTATYYREQLRNLFSLGFIAGARRSIRAADAVHIQSVFSIYTLLALRYAAKYKKPVLLSPNGSLGKWSMEQGSRNKARFLQWFIMPYLSKILFHTSSQQEAEEVQTIFPQAVCAVIANGVNLLEFRTILAPDRASYLRKFAGITRDIDTKIAVCLCRLHKVKGLDILIRSIQIIRQQGGNVILLIAGPDFGEKDFLEHLASDLGLSEHVFFTGELGGADKIAFLQGADVFALPSLHENFGIAYLEALAAGIPVAASTRTPWRDVEEAGCGRWVDPTPENFAEAITDMLDRGKEAYSDNARSYASRFAWDNIARQFIAAYRGKA